MKREVVRDLCMSVLAGLASPLMLWAQTEVLPPERIADYQRHLSDIVQRTSEPLHKAYLQSLQNADTPAITVTNAVRVAQDIEAGKRGPGPIVHYAVPAISDVMRLPDAYPVDGRFNAPLGIVLARDEYEPASFVLYSAADLDQVTLTPGELKNAAGDVLPAGQLDLKVVKVWYQGGNGWFSYFTDVGLELVPELLLKDESLVRVDRQTGSNYARVGEREVWISAPRVFDVAFDPYTPGFADAEQLQPVRLNKGEFKQFFLTVHATRDTKPGLYRGAITATPQGHPAHSLPVAVRVLPFELPLPKSPADLQQDYVVTLMTAWPKLSPDHPAFMPTLRNLRAHNLLHLGPGAGLTTPPDLAAKQVKAMKEAGFQTKPIIGGTMPGWIGTHDGKPLTFDDLMTANRAARDLRDFYMKHFGHTDAAISHGDEQASPWVVKTRPLWRILNEHGLKTNLAGHEHVFTKAGYTMDVHPTAGMPSDAKSARRWHDIGSAAYVSFYASQHNGSENPSFVRRQHGLLGYLSGFNMINNYEFAYGPWNDRAVELYKPMVLAYPTSAGLVDTLAWEGFREGVDDMRYATKLKQLAQEAITSDNLDRIYAGRQARQWLASLDGERVDLNAVRLEMIQKILRLSELSK